MIKPPLVSVLIPVFRVENYIERCARSVLCQTYPNIEDIFVNDDTDDASIDILKKVLLDYPERSERVSIINHTKNEGLAKARNTAIDASRGEFMFHVDSDDWIEEFAVEAMMNRQHETNADIVSAEVYKHVDGLVINDIPSGWDLDKKELLVGILTYKVSTSIWRRIIRRSLYFDNNIKCDERGSAGEDFQVFPRLVYYAKTVSGISTRVYHYNCSNRQSIMNNVRNSLELQIQGLVSVGIVYKFFSEKESPYKEIVRGLDIRYIHYKMLQNALNWKREWYAFFKNLIVDMDSGQWSYIHWDNPIVRHLESHFYSTLLFRYFWGFINKINKIIKNI